MTVRSMVFREVGPLIVSVHSTEAPSPAEWTAYVEVCRRKIARERTLALAVTAGGAPTTKQRQTLQELVRPSPVSAAVVSDAPLIRGVVTALSWFNPAIRCFAFDKGAGVNDALRYLGVDQATAERVRIEVRTMERELVAGGSR